MLNQVVFVAPDSCQQRKGVADFPVALQKKSRILCGLVGPVPVVRYRILDVVEQVFRTCGQNVCSTYKVIQAVIELNAALQSVVTGIAIWWIFKMVAFRFGKLFGRVKIT